jgi:hypothetical protein
MPTQEETKKLIEAFSEVFPTKADFEALKVSFSTLQSSVDAYAKRAEAFF